ncbi:hypothetical protein AWC15_14300 [Mycobacterium lacus]|uniref:Uncharacterized protein n=1 Tax=Mycobacterium lacus TaxID=169765 RepID=A0A1X1YRC8_9MYCO|nr:hypothetical protein AWC15_14300 [Mycobacterium lacus]BBX98233.1 hypothetical protein MLAC_35270 [Mycobacterium lacus]
MASVTTQLADELDWRWRARLRPRLDGLTDHEQFWQPVPNCWTVHPDDSATLCSRRGPVSLVAERVLRAKLRDRNPALRTRSPAFRLR